MLPENEVLLVKFIQHAETAAESTNVRILLKIFVNVSTEIACKPNAFENHCVAAQRWHISQMTLGSKASEKPV